MGRKAFSDFHIDIQRFIKKENLLAPGEKVICGVSGGVDSMTMVRVLKDLGYKVTMAHVNFGLRGRASEEDETWIRTWAEREQIPLKVFQVPASHWEGNQNIQLEARQIRYSWFGSLQKELGIEKLAVAHHADDQVETILFQLFRGSGLAGLRGILPKNGAIIRPLLEKEKKEITLFARAFLKEWRNDASNESDDYQRNQMRHHLMPILRTLFPGFEKVMRRNANRFRILESEINNRFQELQTRFGMPESENGETWNWLAMEKDPSGLFFLAELLRQNGFPFATLDEIRAGANGQEAKVWETEDKRLEVKNGLIHLFQKKELPLVSVLIENLDKGSALLPDNGKLLWSIGDWAENAPSSKDQCWVNIQKLIFPLKVRNWESADRIKPFGLKGKSKKVSDLQTEARLSPAQKQNRLVLVNGDGELIWVLGIRNSETFKIPAGTNMGLQLEWQKKTGLSQ